MPGAKKPSGTWYRLVSAGPTTACIIAVWSSAAPERAADRGVVEGRLGVVLPDACRRSRCGPAPSPSRRAPAAAARAGRVGVFLPVLFAGNQRRGGGGRVRHDPPFDPVEMHHLRPGGPGDRAVLARARIARISCRWSAIPRTRSSALKRKGPLPIISGTWRKGSVLASRSGIMAQTGTQALPSAKGSSGKGRFRRKRMVRSSGAESSSVASIRLAPKGSRCAQRRMLATQSRASTRLAIVPEQAVAQGQGPAPAVILDQWPVHHLRRRLEIGVHAVQRVEDHVAVVAADIGGGGDRIERDQILLRGEAQRGGGLRPHGGRTRQGRDQAGARGRHQGATLHVNGTLFGIVGNFRGYPF